MTPTRIAELRKLIAAATPAPWYLPKGGNANLPIPIRAMQGPIEVCPAIANGLDEAHLIAAARTALPEALDEIELLRTSEEVLEEHLAQIPPLRARVKRLEEALKPFAKRANDADRTADSETAQLPIRASDLRRAREALEGT